MMELVVNYDTLEKVRFISQSQVDTLAWIKPDWMTHRFDFEVRVNNLTENNRGTPCVFPVGRKLSSLRKAIIKPGEEEEYQQFLKVLEKWAPRPNKRVIYDELFTPAVYLTKEVQLFFADIYGLWIYNTLWADLDRTQKETVADLVIGLLGEGLAYANGVGFGDEPRADYLHNRDLDAPLARMYVFVDGTDTVKILGEDGDYILLDSWLEGKLPKNYGREILYDHRIRWCTMIYPNRTVTPFPTLRNIQVGLSVPRPFITKEPVYYWRGETQIYQPPRRGLYWPERVGTPNGRWITEMTE